MSPLCIICFLVTGKAPKIGAGVLNQREGTYYSGQRKAEPTRPTLTTVPSIRNEMANGNLETTPIRTNCGGHVSWSGCFGCPNRAPNKQARCLFNSSYHPYMWLLNTFLLNSGRSIVTASVNGSSSHGQGMMENVFTKIHKQV